MNTPRKISVLIFTSLFLATAGYGKLKAKTTIEPTPVNNLTSSDNVLSGLKPDHPRLLVTSYNDFDALKARISSDPYLQKCYANLTKRADSLVGAPLKQYTTSAPNYLLGSSRNILDRSYTLGLMFRLTHDNRYKDRLWAELNNAASYPDWYPPHFLGVAEMTHAFAIAYDWLYDVWTPAQRAVLKNAIVQKGLTPGNAYYGDGTPPRGVNFAKVDNNWNQVCNGGLTLGALAIADQEPALCSSIIKNAVAAVPIAMKHFAPDGAWFEGPLYLQYALRYNVAMIAALQSALGTDFGLSTQPGFPGAGKFIIAMSGATGATFNYGDCPEEVISVPEMFWLAKRFNEPLLASYEKQWSQYTALDMLWYTNGQASGISPNNYFRGAEVASLRSAWNDKDAWFVGFKAGQNGINHGHLDLGSFVLEKDGERWISDPGPDNYGLPGYFKGDRHKSSQRWSYYKTGTDGHSTMFIRDGDGDNQNPDAVTRIKKFSADPGNPFGIMDLTAAYTPDLTSSLRGIRLINNKQVLIEDEVKSNSPQNIFWQVQTYADVQISGDQRSAILSLDGKQLKVVILTPAQAHFEVMQPGRISSNEGRKGQSGSIKRLVIHLDNFAGGRIGVIFKEPNDSSGYNLVPLNTW